LRIILLFVKKIVKRESGIAVGTVGVAVEPVGCIFGDLEEGGAKIRQMTREKISSAEERAVFSTRDALRVVPTWR